MPKKKKKTAAGGRPRARIDADGLIAALEAHVLEGKKMSPTQVSAALALLKAAIGSVPADGAETGGGHGHEAALRDLE